MLPCRTSWLPRKSCKWWLPSASFICLLLPHLSIWRGWKQVLVLTLWPLPPVFALICQLRTVTFHALRLGWGALSRYWQEALMVPMAWESFTKILKVLAAGAFFRVFIQRSGHGCNLCPCINTRVVAPSILSVPKVTGSRMSQACL